METGIMRRDQLPAGGCDNCGAYEGEPQHILRKCLVWSSNEWVCKECATEEEGE